MLVHSFGITREVSDEQWQQYIDNIEYMPDNFDPVKHWQTVLADKNIQTGVKITLENRGIELLNAMLPEEVFEFIWPQSQFGYYPGYDFSYPAKFNIKSKDPRYKYNTPLHIDILSLPSRNNKYLDNSIVWKWLAVGIVRSDWDAHIYLGTKYPFTFKFGLINGNGYGFREQFDYWKSVIRSSM